MPNSSNFQQQFQWEPMTEFQQQVLLAYRRADAKGKLALVETIDRALEQERLLKREQAKSRTHLRLVKSDINARSNHD